MDLDAVSHNASELKRHIGARALIAVLKANAYGHGAVQIAREVLGAGATWVATFTVGEAVQLREAGIDAPLLVLGPFEEGEAPVYSRLSLMAAVGDERSVDRLSRFSPVPVGVHLMIDSGLHREGIAPEHAANLAQAISDRPNLVLAGVGTHFARADEPGHQLNQDQVEIFLSALGAIRNAGIRVPFVHAANTGATLYRADALFDGVRCGLALFGYAPNSATPHPLALRPALSLLSRIARVHEVAEGAGVGYGHTFVARRRSRIALVPIGYGDGLHRSLQAGNGAVLIDGLAAPVVGRISMDQITVDITDIGTARVGSEVVLVGSSLGTVQTAHDLAARMDTIPYEVLTSIAPRVPRVYLKGGAIVGER